MWIRSLFLMVVFATACQNNTTVPPTPPSIHKKKATKPAIKKHRKKYKYPSLKGFTNIKTIAPKVVLDIRYATTNNFTGAQIYNCPSCYLRPEAAKALAKVNAKLRKQGIGVKVFDCYRPLPAQQKLWDKVPNASYVTPPSKGSMHNRGMAVDLTIFDISKMQELYMGSPYDFFGPKAHTDYTLSSPKVKANRAILHKAMLEAGFRGIRTEWWHYSYAGPLAPLSKKEWICE